VISAVVVIADRRVAGRVAPDTMGITQRLWIASILAWGVIHAAGPRGGDRPDRSGVGRLAFRPFHSASVRSHHGGQFDGVDQAASPERRSRRDRIRGASVHDGRAERDCPTRARPVPIRDAALTSRVDEILKTPRSRAGDPRSGEPRTPSAGAGADSVRQEDGLRELIETRFKEAQAEFRPHSAGVGELSRMSRRRMSARCE